MRHLPPVCAPVCGGVRLLPRPPHVPAPCGRAVRVRARALAPGVPALAGRAGGDDGGGGCACARRHAEELDNFAVRVLGHVTCLLRWWRHCGRLCAGSDVHEFGRAPGSRWSGTRAHAGFAAEMDAAAMAGAAATYAASAEAMDADGGVAAGPCDPKQAPGSAEAAEPSPAPEEKPLAKPAKGKAGRKCACFSFHTHCMYLNRMMYCST